MFHVRRAKQDYLKEYRRQKEEKPYIFTPLKKANKKSIFSDGSGKVVLYALLVLVYVV